TPAIGIAQSGRRFAARMRVPADAVRVSASHPPEARRSLPAWEETMDSTKDTKPGGLQSTFSRRTLLKGATALTAAASGPEAFGQQPTGAPHGTVWLYIGTYTGAPGPRGRSGMGIYLCALNLSTGELTVVRLVAPALPAMGMTPSTASSSTIALD